MRSIIVASDGRKMEERLNLIDNIERLGVAYHFEKEIDQQIHELYNAYPTFENDDLHTVALYFRLLRQHGHDISTGN